eukprot:598278-Hanusia_phi.AAC.7
MWEEVDEEGSASGEEAVVVVQNAASERNSDRTCAAASERSRSVKAGSSGRSIVSSEAEEEDSPAPALQASSRHSRYKSLSVHADARVAAAGGSGGEAGANRRDDGRPLSASVSCAKKRCSALTSSSSLPDMSQRDEAGGLQDELNGKGWKEEEKLSDGSSNMEAFGKCGVGLYFEKRKDMAMAIVTEMAQRGSAAREGTIMAGDAIHRIDGKDISAWTAAQTQAALMGEQGSSVLLDIVREPDVQLQVKLMRGNAMFWYWHEKNSTLTEKNLLLLAANRELQEQVRAWEERCMWEKREVEHQLIEEKGKIEELARQLAQIQNVHQEELDGVQRSAEAKLQEEKSAYRTKMRELERRDAANRKEYEQRLLAKSSELDYAMMERAQEHADSLMKVTCSFQSKLREAEQAFVERNLELERELSKRLLEFERISKTKAEEHAEKLEEVTNKLNDLTVDFQCQLADLQYENSEKLMAQVNQYESRLNCERGASEEERKKLQTALVEMRREMDGLQLEKKSVESELKRAQSEASEWKKAAEKERESRVQGESQFKQEMVTKEEQWKRSLQQESDQLRAAWDSDRKEKLRVECENRRMVGRLAELEDENERLARALEKLREEGKGNEEKHGHLPPRPPPQCEEIVSKMEEICRELREERRGGFPCPACRPASHVTFAGEQVREELAAVSSGIEWIRGRMEREEGEKSRLFDPRTGEQRQRDEHANLSPPQSSLEGLQELTALRRERDFFKAKLEQLLALPDPCGVGIRFELKHKVPCLLSLFDSLTTHAPLAFPPPLPPLPLLASCSPSALLFPFLFTSFLLSLPFPYLLCFLPLPPTFPRPAFYVPSPLLLDTASSRLLPCSPCLTSFQSLLVRELVPGMSAERCESIARGDELLGIDETPTTTLSLLDTQRVFSTSDFPPQHSFLV